MPLTVTKQDAAARFPELIDLAATDGPPVVVEENGTILAAIVRHDRYAEFLAATSNEHPAQPEE